MNNKKILVVEDDLHIALGLEEVLRQEGFSPVICKRGDKAMETVLREHPALILMDVMLPGENGFDLCRELRRRRIRTPVLMLSAKSQELDKVIGFQSGADDYVSKPFGVRELTARIHALLRRCNSKDAAPAPVANSTFRIGAIVIDPARLQLEKEGKWISLTARELKLLQLFHRHPGEVLSRDKLLGEVWGFKYLGTTRTLDQVIVQLRKKLGDNGDHPRHLLTVHGVGYKFVP